MRYLYRLIDLEPLHLDTNALPDLLRAAEQMHFTGLNITYPCKQAILPLLDELSDEARGIGAVNTVVFKDGKRIGHNTDCLGFAEGFRRNLDDVPRQRVVQMGAGGAGAAVAHALLAEGVEHLSIFDVDASRARDLVDNLAQRFGSGRAQVGLRSRQRDGRGRWSGQHHANGHGQTAGYAGAGDSVAGAIVGRGNRVLPAGNRTAAQRPRLGLPHVGWRQYGGVSGGKGV